jgi:hypothetical protein
LIWVKAMGVVRNIDRCRARHGVSAAQGANEPTVQCLHIIDTCQLQGRAEPCSPARKNEKFFPSCVAVANQGTETSPI